MFDPDSFWEGSKGASTGGWAVPTGHTIQRFPKFEAAILMGQTIAGWSPSSGRGHGGQAPRRAGQGQTAAAGIRKSLGAKLKSIARGGEQESRGARDVGNQSAWTLFNHGAMFLSRQAWSHTWGLSMPMF